MHFGNKFKKVPVQRAQLLKTKYSKKKQFPPRISLILNLRKTCFSFRIAFSDDTASDEKISC